MQTGNKEIRLRAGGGSLLGLPAITAKEPYTMTAKACWDAEILKLSSDAFKDLMESEPQMQQATLRILAGEVRAARQALAPLAFGPKL